MELLPENERSMTADDMIKDIRKDVDRFAGVSVEIMKMEQGPGQGKPIKIQIASYDRDQLAPTTELIAPVSECLLRYQSAPPQGARPQGAAMWGRPGLGPHQAPPLRR